MEGMRRALLVLLLAAPAAAGNYGRTPLARPLVAAERVTPAWNRALMSRLLTSWGPALDFNGLDPALANAEGPALAPLVAALEARGVTPATVTDAPPSEALGAARRSVDDLAANLAEEIFAADEASSVTLSRDADKTLEWFGPYLSRRRRAELRLAASAARIKARLPATDAYLHAKNWAEAKPGGDPLMHAARAFSGSLGTALDELDSALSRRATPADSGLRIARAVEEGRALALADKGVSRETADRLATAQLRTLSSWARKHGEYPMISAASETSGRLTVLSHKRFFFLKPFKTEAQFLEKAEKLLAGVQLKTPSTAASLIGLAGGIAMVASAAYAALTGVFPPLPAAIDWGVVFGLPSTAAIVQWTAISLGMLPLTMLSGEKFDRRFNPFGMIGIGRVLKQLPPLMVLEEGVFRLALTLAPAALAAALGAAPLGALLVATVAASALFARAHTYGPKLPRFLFGLLMTYVMLTHGFLTALIAHTLLDVVLFGLNGLTDALSTRRKL